MINLMFSILSCKKFLTFYFILSLLAFPVFGALIKGQVSDSSGEPLAFATLYVKGTSIGTTTNEKGDYLLQLSPGQYELVFQYVGYKAKLITVQLKEEELKLDVRLESESLVLKEIVIRANEDDYAYQIIRSAQEKRKYYLREEINAYQCNVYMKGLQRLKEKPKSFMGVRINADTGVVYFSESFSELSFRQPGQYKEKMISSKVSGNNRGFSFNSAIGSWINLYENISGDENSERGVVSPIAANALAYYRYRWLGTISQGNLVIHKIKLIPRRENAPAYSGFIYIIDGDWRIHSTELYINKGRIEFIDSAAVQQVYAPDPQSQAWLPLSQKVTFDFKAFGFKGGGYFVNIYSKYQVSPAFDLKHFSKETLKVEKDANQRDSTYWKTLRPIPLTVEEIKDYRTKDSLLVIKESKSYKDSVDSERNKPSIGALLWAGYTLRNSYKRSSLSFQPLLRTFQYNTVEGFVTDFNISYRKSFEDRRFFSINPTFRYGFSNQRPQFRLNFRYLYKPLRSSYFALEGGRYVEQLSRQNSISPIVNSFYTLVNEQNYLKIYEKSYAKGSFNSEIINGIRLNTSLEYGIRRTMENTSDYRFRDVANREFSPNLPVNLGTVTDELATTNRALTYTLILQFNPGQKYALYPNRKFVLENKYPTFILGYRKGLAILDSEVNYDLLYLNINKELSFGLVGRSNFEVEAGNFFNAASLPFVDYRHFLGNQTLFINNQPGSYYLLDYYTFSANSSYVKGHYEHHFNGFFLNGIPLLRKLKLQEVILFNYLYTPVLSNYFELGVGIEHIFKILRIDFVGAWQRTGGFNKGLRIGVGF